METSSSEVEVEVDSDEGVFQEEPSTGDLWSRSGANIDPLVMFAMAKVPFAEDSIICDTEDCSKAAGAFRAPRTIVL